MTKNTYDAEIARRLLHELGIVPHYKGYQIILASLDCIAENEEHLTAFSKEICIPVSEKLGCSIATVEATIRRSSERAWNCNPELTCQLVSMPLSSRPAVIVFLEGLYFASKSKGGDC